MRCWSRLAEEETHYDRGRTASNPKKCALLKMQVQVHRGSNAFTDMLCINRAKECGNRKDQEINPASRAAFHIVWIDFFDDAVRNHRRARCDAEYEHRDVRRNWDGLERELEASQNHDRRAPDDHWLSPSYAVRKPSQQRTSKNPAERNHRGDDHRVVKGKLQIFLK